MRDWYVRLVPAALVYDKLLLITGPEQDPAFLNGSHADLFAPFCKLQNIIDVCTHTWEGREEGKEGAKERERWGESKGN